MGTVHTAESVAWEDGFLEAYRIGTEVVVRRSPMVEADERDAMYQPVAKYLANQDARLVEQTEVDDAGMMKLRAIRSVYLVGQPIAEAA